MRGLARVSWLAAILLVTGCAATDTSRVPMGGSSIRPPNLDHVLVDFRDLPGWADDDHAAAVTAFHRTCDWMRVQSPSKPLGANRAAGTVAEWLPACDAALALPAGDRVAARQFFETHFRPVSLAAPEDSGLFTGYYEIELNGSWTRTERFNVPIYRSPIRGKRGLPTRSRIEAGALARKGLEIMWVDDPIDAFFLEIQGSGRVHMTDGSVVGLGYGGQNGHRYYPIGRHLIELGVATPEEMSLQLIRRWLKENPSQARHVMNLNPSYVFFKVASEVGARGARNMPLTPGRSLAVDPDYVPLGAPVWLELKEAPVPGGEIRRLVVAQDTGGAIKGAVRGDLFWGHGREAEQGAGVMKARGRYTMLVPRQAIVTAQAR